MNWLFEGTLASKDSLWSLQRLLASRSPGFTRWEAWSYRLLCSRPSWPGCGLQSPEGQHCGALHCPKPILGCLPHRCRMPSFLDGTATATLTLSMSSEREDSQSIGPALSCSVKPG
jgi:hypothetical protein